MEKEKTLSSVESIELIKSMIAESRENYESNGGSIFLVWGYTSLIVSALIYILTVMNDFQWAHWLWWLIPLIGWPSMFFLNRKEKRHVTTFVDRFISITWIIVGSVAGLLPIVLSVSYLGDLIIPFEGLILGMGTVITGLVIKFKPIIFGGITAIIISMVMLMMMKYFIISFMILFILSMIIPGHLIIYQESKKSKSKLQCSRS